jgi:hypothetical protein
MIEADDDEKMKWQTPRKTSLARQFTDRSKTTEVNLQSDAHPQRHPQNLTSKDRNSSTTRTTDVKRKPDNNRGLQSLQRNLSYGKERAENDLTVMMFTLPDYTRRLDAPTPRIERPPEPLSPGTQRWDEFMDFPSENFMHSYHAEDDQPPIMSEQLTATACLTGVPEEEDLQEASQVYHVGVPMAREDSGSSAGLTWNLAMSEVMSHEAVDPAIRKAIRERVRNSETTKGSDNGEPIFVSTAEAGLVPNFSYPIAAAAYYDRLAGEQPKSPVLTNGIESEPSEAEQFEQDRRTSTIVNRCSTPEQRWPLKDLPDGISSSSSSTMTEDSLYRPPTPDWTTVVPKRVRNLLKEVLTPSELSLCNDIIKASSITLTPPTSPGHDNYLKKACTSHGTPIDTEPTKRINTKPAPPALIRLVTKLHTLLHHLQDRATYLEDNLLPILGTALERKTFTIDVLSIEIQNLGDQVRELKTAVDFGNRILAGCWVREYEVWRTLATIREKRQRRGGMGLLRRMTGRKTKLANGVLSPMNYSRAQTPVSKAKQALTTRELDALVLMAEQNVQILREDVDEMVDRVEKCKRTIRAYEAVEREEGSWRDV